MEPAFSVVYFNACSCFFVTFFGFEGLVTLVTLVAGLPLGLPALALPPPFLSPSPRCLLFFFPRSSSEEAELVFAGPPSYFSNNSHEPASHCSPA
jgi:hypothetical protein